MVGAVMPGGAGAGGAPGKQAAVGYYRVGVVGADDQVKVGFFVGGVVAGEPTGSTAGLRCHERAVGQFLPPQLTPDGADRPGSAHISDGEVKLLVLGNALCEKHPQFSLCVPEFGHLDAHAAHAAGADLGHAHVVGEVKGEAAKLLVVFYCEHRRAGQAVRSDPVIQRQLVVTHMKTQVEVNPGIGIADTGDGGAAQPRGSHRLCILVGLVPQPRQNRPHPAVFVVGCEPQFDEHVSHVLAYRTGAHNKAVTDFGIAQSLRHQSEYFLLTAG